MQGKLNHLRMLESSLTKLYIARQMFDQAYPEIIGNQPEYKELLHSILDGFDKVTIEAFHKIQAVEQSVQRIEGCTCETASINPQDHLADCPYRQSFNR